MKKNHEQGGSALEKNKIDLDNLRFCKAMLMLLIALGHSIAYWDGWQNADLGAPIFTSRIFARITDYLSQTHVYAFVVISGYLFCYLRVEKGKYERYGDFLKIKAKRLLIPLVFVSIVWLIPFALTALKYDGRRILNNFVLMEGALQLWFLLSLFWVFVIAWPLSKIFSWRGHNYGWVCLAVTGLMWIGCFLVFNKFDIPNCFQLVATLQYVLPFFVGYAMRFYGDRKFYRIPAVIWIIADLAVYWAYMITPFQGGLLKAIKIGCGCLHLNLGGVMLFMILAKIAERVSWRKSKTVTFFAEHSMTVYLFHEQFIYLTIPLLNGLLPPALHGMVNFVVCVAGASLISLIFDKFPRLKVLIGEK